jgi:hypothetical protein
VGGDAHVEESYAADKFSMFFSVNRSGKFELTISPRLVAGLKFDQNL